MIRSMSVFLLLAMSATSLVAAAEVRNTADDEVVTPIVRTPEMDADDLALAKKVGSKFAADIMKVRETEDIHKFSDWLLPSVTFQICDNRLDQGQLQWYIAKASLEKEQFPTPLVIDAVDAYTRGDFLSFVAKASGFIFEDNDSIILDFKKQKDESWKLVHGTILTCRKE